MTAYLTAQELPAGNGQELLQCQRNPYIRSTMARVLSCEKVAKVQKASSEDRYAITLSNTILYPEGGGQPSDMGRLLVDGSEVSVSNVERDAVGILVHFAGSYVEPGCEVEVQVDWDRRFDFMQHHTGQHLLSAVIEDLLGAETASWEMHPQSQPGALDTVCIDVTAAGLSAQQVSAVEQAANEHIRANLSVQQIVLDGSDQEQFTQLQQSPMFRGKLPPPDKIKGLLRFIHIDTVDINACGGTHLQSLGEIQALKLVGVESKKGLARLRFIAGGRLLGVLGRCLLNETLLNKALGCGPAEHESAVRNILQDRKQAVKARDGLAQELAQIAGTALVADAPTSGAVRAYHRPGADALFLRWVAAAAQEASPGTLLLLTASTDAEGKAGPMGLEGTFWLAGPADLVKRLGPRVAEVLGGRGGGRPGVYQGKASRVDRAEEARLLLERELQSGNPVA